MEAGLADVLAAGVGHPPDDVGPAEAEAAELLVEDLEKIDTFLAGRVEDVCEETPSAHGRLAEVFPLLEGFEDGDAEHSDLESEASEARLARRRLVCGDADSPEAASEALLVEVIRDEGVEGAIDDEEVLR